MRLKQAWHFYYQNFLVEDKLTLEEKRWRDRRTPRVALRTYAHSSFKYLFNSGNDQSLLNCCGVSHAVFQELLELFEPYYNKYTLDDDGNVRPITFTSNGKRKGRKRDLDAIGCLGLVLYWYRTRGSVARAAPMAFGLTSTPLYKWLKFGRRILLAAIQHHPAAKVQVPSKEELDAFKNCIGAKYPILKDVWGAADGLKLHIEQSTNWSKQNYYYNGWTSSSMTLHNLFPFIRTNG